MPSLKEIENIWDKKTNAQILLAYDEAIKTIYIANTKSWKDNETVNELAKVSEDRLNKYIIPQIKKRKIGAVYLSNP